MIPLLVRLPRGTRITFIVGGLLFGAGAAGVDVLGTARVVAYNRRDAFTAF